MRVLGCLVLGFLIMAAGSAPALEASAGADNVNTSQIGLNAKLDAVNTATTAAINKILNCQKSGQLFDPTGGTCITVDEVLAKKIAACTTNKEFYDQNTGACMASAPDLTNALNTTNTNLGDLSTLVHKMLNCSNAKQFYNSGTGGCASAATSFSFSTYDINNPNGNTDVGWHRFCAVAGLGGGAPNGGTQKVWPNGGPNANGQYHWYALNSKTPKYWTPDFYLVCGD